MSVLVVVRYTPLRELIIRAISQLCLGVYVVGAGYIEKAREMYDAGEFKVVIVNDDFIPSPAGDAFVRYVCDSGSRVIIHAYVPLPPEFDPSMVLVNDAGKIGNLLSLVERVRHDLN